MIKTSKAAFALAILLAVSVPNAIYAGTLNHDLRGGPGDDTVMTRIVKTIKWVVRTILEQPAIPIPDPPPVH